MKDGDAAHLTHSTRPAAPGADGIRPLTRDDLPAATALFRRQLSSASDAGAVEAFLRGTLLDSPWAGTVGPSLVWESEGRIVGLLGSIERRYSISGEPGGLVAAAHLAADPDFKNRAVGVLLLSRLMSGPQALAVSLSATPVAQRLWVGIGGVADNLRGLTYTVVLRRAAYAAQLGFQQLRAEKPVRGVARAVRGRGRADGAPDARIVSEPLTSDGYVEALAALAPETPISPVLDEAGAAWLFGRLERGGPGEPVCRRVTVGGRVIGWYIARAMPDGAWLVLEAWSRRRTVGEVLDRLIADAAAAGAISVTGQVDHRFAGHVQERATLYRPGARAVIHGPAPIVEALFRGDALISPFLTEWESPARG